ncbi:hypothetical protein BSKO_05366 [Bryopsis sp. KO-2023]|nr:hypothetical protein BSKO_05366 [Bryopsis sp. KO-2023]
MARLSGGKKRLREEAGVPNTSQKAARKAQGCRKSEVAVLWSAGQRCGGCTRSLKNSKGKMCFCCSKPLCMNCGKQVKCGIVCQDECHERWLLAANIPDWQAWGKWEFMDDESLDRLVKLLTIFEKHPFKLDPVTFANDPLSRSNFSFLFTEDTQGKEDGARHDWNRATVGCVLRILGPGAAEISHIQRDVQNGLPGGGKRALMELAARVQTWNRKGSLDINKFFIPATEDAVDKFWMKIDGMKKMSTAEVEEMFRTYRLSIESDHEFRHMTTWLKWEPFDFRFGESSRLGKSSWVAEEKECVAKTVQIDCQKPPAKCLEKPQADTIQRDATPCALTPTTTKQDNFAFCGAGLLSAASTRTPFSLPWVPEGLDLTRYDGEIGIWEDAGGTIGSGDDEQWEDCGFWGDHTSQWSCVNASSSGGSPLSPGTEQSEGPGDGDDDQEPHGGSSQGEQVFDGSVLPAESVEAVVADVEPSGDGSHPSAAVEEVSTPNEKAFDDQWPEGEATTVSGLFFDLC